jgi:hypothetical protein
VIPGQVEGLEAGVDVRWKQRGRWRHGKLGDPPLGRDGSLRVYDDFNGAERSLRPAFVQLLTRGPRGGRCWVSCQLGGPPLARPLSGGERAAMVQKAREHEHRPPPPGGGGGIASG